MVFSLPKRQTKCNINGIIDFIDVLLKQICLTNTLKANYIEPNYAKQGNLLLIQNKVIFNFSKFSLSESFHVMKPTDLVYKLIILSSTFWSKFHLLYISIFQHTKIWLLYNNNEIMCLIGWYFVLFVFFQFALRLSSYMSVSKFVNLIPSWQHTFNLKASRMKVAKSDFVFTQLQLVIKSVEFWCTYLNR